MSKKLLGSFVILSAVFILVLLLLGSFMVKEHFSVSGYTKGTQGKCNNSKIQRENCTGGNPSLCNSGLYNDGGKCKQAYTSGICAAQQKGSQQQGECQR